MLLSECKIKTGLLSGENEKISLYHMLCVNFPLKLCMVPLIISILLFEK